AVPPLPDRGLGGRAARHAGHPGGRPVMTGGVGMTGGALTASAAGLRLIGHHDLGGHDDGMQAIRHGRAVYVGTSAPRGRDLGARRRRSGATGAGHPVACPAAQPHPRGADSRRPAAGQPREVPYPAPDTGRVSAGLARYGLVDPLRPAQVAFWPSGGRGVHQVVWSGGRYAHMSAIPEHYRDRIWVVVDLADPAHPVEAGRWWWPGQRDDETPSWPAGQRYAAHHALIAGDRAYLGYDDAGLVVLDVTD